MKTLVEVLVNTPKRIQLLIPLAALLVALPARAAQKDCDAAFSQYDSQIHDLNDKRDQADDSSKSMITSQIVSLTDAKFAAQRQCIADNKADQEKQNDIAKEQSNCTDKAKQYPDVYSWDAKKNRCVNKLDAQSSRALPSSDDCSSASVFAGDLKGQNCKAALNTIKDVKARNSAITDATTAATTAYSGLQAQGATGAQSDAQTRQANIMKTLAFSKLATGALSLTGAMQLKSAASGAEDANSTISGAQQNLQSACANAADDQACFYQNAAQYGVPADQRNYASFARMKQGAQQAQDQADQANALAKSSMLSGAADMLVGLQALKAAQMANNNAGAMAPPPMFVPPPPPQQISLGGASAGPAAPSLAPGTGAGLTDYGNPKNDGATFGPQHHGQIGGVLNGHMGSPNIFKSASSGVSGGGGGGGAGISPGALRGGGPGARAAGGRRITNAGEYNLAGGGGKTGGVGDKAGGEKDNPLADMLAKMFPQGQDGKPVVDTRQIASANGNVADDEQADPTVTAADLSIFEQITAKYRQLNNSGRF